jgi:hypothetical protein
MKGADATSALRFILTILVRRWNWSTVSPGKDLPAPPVGSVWDGPARKSPAAPGL